MNAASTHPLDSLALYRPGFLSTLKGMVITCVTNPKTPIGRPYHTSDSLNQAQQSELDVSFLDRNNASPLESRPEPYLIVPHLIINLETMPFSMETHYII